MTAFYDIDTPVTLAKLGRRDFEYLSPEVIPGYNLYLSFTGGPTLRRIERQYGSPIARALYCSVDPDAYEPLDLPKKWHLTYLGTYSDDRQPTLDELLLEPARKLPHLNFCVAGSMATVGQKVSARVLIAAGLALVGAGLALLTVLGVDSAFSAIVQFLLGLLG